MKRNCWLFAFVVLDALFPTTRAAAGTCHPIPYFLETQALRPGSPGSPDPSFRHGLATDLDGGIGPVAIQPDGKVIIAGTFSWIRGVRRHSIARLNPDGSLDTSFDAKDIFNRDDRGIGSLLLQPDGKIVIGGTLRNNRVLRLNSDGSLNSAFQAEFEDPEWQLFLHLVHDDGKMIVSAYSATIRRLNADGTLDAGFHIPRITTTVSRIFNSVYLQAVEKQPDGKLVIAGSFTRVDGVQRVGLARLNNDGTLDRTFQPPLLGPTELYSVRSVAIRPDGSIVVAFVEFFEGDGTTSFRQRIVRLHQDGSLDPSFSLSPQITAGGFRVQAGDDGKIWVRGGGLKVNDRPIALARLTDDGSVDTSFDASSSGLIPDDAVSVWPAGNGKVLFVNPSWSRGIALGRLDSSGQLDSSFPPLSVTVQRISVLAVQADGKILAAGSFAGSHGTIPAGNIARFNTDGTLDTAFSGATITLGTCDGAITAIALQPDGKIVISGGFFSLNDVPQEWIARLNADGSLDNSFRSPFNAKDRERVSGCNAINALTLQAGGKILVAGRFGTVAQTNRPGIARLNLDGSLDLSFRPDSVFPTNGMAVFSVVVQPDQRIVLAGSTGLYRLNTDGGLDISFGDGSGLQGRGGAARGPITLQPDGKMLVLSAGAQRLERRNSDGRLDPSFQGPIARSSCYDFFTDEVNFFIVDLVAIALQTNGKIVISGQFSKVDEGTRYGIARLHPDGSLDSGFDAGTGLMTDRQPTGALALALQADGGVLVGGSFTSVNGGGPGYLARLFGGEAPTILPRSLRKLPTGEFQFQATGPTNQTWIIQATTNVAGTNWTAIATNTMGIESLRFSDPGATKIPNSFYRAVLRE